MNNNYKPTKQNTMESIQFTKEHVTPKMAMALLKANEGNRRIRETTVLKYSNDMRSGRWKQDTAETIKISVSGRIVDGQHRLSAIVHSGVSIYAHIAYNVPEGVFDVLDTGKPRNTSDTLNVAGVKNASVVAAIIAVYSALSKNIAASTGEKHYIGTNAMHLQTYMQRPDFWQETARKTNSRYEAFARILPCSLVGGLYSHLYDKHPEKAEKFMNELCTGVEITNKTIVVLRNLLIKDKVALRKISINLKTTLILKAWNHYVMGNKVSRLTYSDKEGKITAIKPY